MGQACPCQEGPKSQEKERVETLAVSTQAGSDGDDEQSIPVLPQPEAKLDEEAFTEFEVEWRRPDQATILGLDTQYRSSKLRITGIHANGLVERLNAESPKTAVRVGDALVAVNGVTDDMSLPSPASRMVGEFKRALVLQVLVRREP
mmetsp:Transcript_6404/g.11145  ORF Transcript_6404/g.11145 Transcript_6404/m.11145 type:complete len:147 (-) Transcript_6404:122-562(-)